MSSGMTPQGTRSSAPSLGPERPMNAFLIFKRRSAHLVRGMNLSGREANRQVALWWRNMSDAERAPYYLEAERSRQRFENITGIHIYRSRGRRNRAGNGIATAQGNNATTTSNNHMNVNHNNQPHSVLPTHQNLGQPHVQPTFIVPNITYPGLNGNQTTPGQNSSGAGSSGTTNADPNGGTGSTTANSGSTSQGSPNTNE